MCHLVRRRYYCDHPSSESYWNPTTAAQCESALAAAVYDVNGRLQRCTGPGYTTATFQDHGHCNNSSCRKKAFKKAGWRCHQCGFRVEPNSNCACGHSGCRRCSL
ncbi:hypothetical protein F5Y17DRAFT_453385 [Xylariaceae sp. FL0594]|nr:hypothetical protein F5Y17DRAFT_453385 [Xylariaceae sp. FL0594]